jgi:leucyl-tRNA synthetase
MSDIPAHRYTAALAGTIETSWQQRWEREGTFVQPNPGDAGFDASRPKFYCLDMFPYPSGAGLHVGHPEGYTATDITCRYKRMKGFNVLHPMGWDAFGLPAEQYAIQTGIHPAITTKGAIDNFRRQLKRFGFSYDWSREFGTIDPGYYTWTQWIFLRLYDSWFDPAADKARPIAELVSALERGVHAINLSGELVAAPIAPAPIAGEPIGLRFWHELSQVERRAFIDAHRLAYIGESTVNWCPKLGTVLANDEVIDGKSERGGFPVLRKPLKQWMFRITAYADRLLRQLNDLDWPASTKTMQSEWIGKSEGAEVEFELVGVDQDLRVFTTRPDTLFGATYMVVAPEHPIVDEAISRGGPSALREYVRAAKNRSDIERMESKEKTGVDTGLRAINPATGEEILVWAADYVLTGYGTGAIMAVPAHDERDFEFAQKFGLPLRVVVDHVFDTPEPVRHILHQHFAHEAMYSAIWLPATNADTHTPIADIRARLSSGGDLVSDAGAGEWGRVLLVRNPMGDAVVAALKAPVFQYDLTKPHVDEGHAVNSANAEVSLNGLSTPQAKAKVIAWLEKSGRGRRKVNFKLRDWTFSRQRYWGEPFPIVYTKDGTPYPVSDGALPVTLPELADYAPVESEDPQPLLAKAGDWVNTTAGRAGVDPAILPPETPVRRETNTMPGSAGSSWYAIRYCDAKNNERLVGVEAERYWMGPREGAVGGVDLYLGGSEHAVGHLLYSRFWQNVLFDLGFVTTSEPFRKLFHQGLITSFAYQRPDRSLVPADQIEERSEGKYFERATGQPLAQVVAKMSKSLKNVVNPDDVIAEYGADTMRLYEMYMGPLDASKPWNPRDITGLFRFLQRAWRTVIDETTGQARLAATRDEKVERELHRTIARVGPQIEKLAFNTAIADLIKFINAVPAGDAAALTCDQAERFALILAPFAPHIAEEIWSRVGNAASLSHQPWPTFDPAQLQDSTIEVPVQILGKLRARITVPAGADPKALEAAALAEPRIKELIEGKKIAKVIVIPGKLVNIVAN